MTSAWRLTKSDVPVIATSAVASVSLAAIFWVVAHHPATPPARASQPPAAHSYSHQARTLPAVHNAGSRTTPPAEQPVVVLAHNNPAPRPSPAPSPSASQPTPQPTLPSPAPPSASSLPQILSVPSTCLVLVVQVCLPPIGVTP